MTKYTVGFLFNKDFRLVCLIRKNRPAWQFGMLNGIGGHIEFNETPIDCMKREFNEECDYRHQVDWKEFAFLNSQDFIVFCYCAIGFPSLVFAKEDEPIETIMVSTISSRTDLIENVPWLVHCAIDFLQDGRPAYISAEYPYPSDPILKSEIKTVYM